MFRALLGILILMPELAHAEVSEKIWSLPMMWVFSLTAGISFMAGGYWKWPFVLPALLLSIALASGVNDMANDEFMYQAVVAEQGQQYFINGYVSAALIGFLAIMGPIAGRVLRKRRPLNK